jgi:hypothetical protein
MNSQAVNLGSTAKGRLKRERQRGCRCLVAEDYEFGLHAFLPPIKGRDGAEGTVLRFIS